MGSGGLLDLLVVAVLVFCTAPACRFSTRATLAAFTISALLFGGGIVERKPRQRYAARQRVDPSGKKGAFLYGTKSVFLA